MDGIINLLKPPGMSSNSAVSHVKRLLNTKKVGHAGTLDPGACGVLVILLGKGTKLSQHLMDGEKEYIFEITFGARTDTQDAYGQVVERHVKNVSKDMIEAIIPSFIGNIKQTPPAFSAISVNGQRSYHLARKGIEVKLEPREITIHALDLLDQTGVNRFLLRAKCSKGTYIRTLAEDIARAMGTCAYTSFLERTQSGVFGIEDAVTLDDLEEVVVRDVVSEHVLLLEQAVMDFKSVIIDKQDYKRITNGLSGRVMASETNDESNQEALHRIYCKNQLIGLGVIKQGQAIIKTHLLPG